MYLGAWLTSIRWDNHAPLRYNNLCTHKQAIYTINYFMIIQICMGQTDHTKTTKHKSRRSFWKNKQTKRHRDMNLGQLHVYYDWHKCIGNSDSRIKNLTINWTLWVDAKLGHFKQGKNMFIYKTAYFCQLMLNILYIKPVWFYFIHVTAYTGHAHVYTTIWSLWHEYVWIDSCKQTINSI